MARGHQRKMRCPEEAGQKKKQGHDQKAAAKAALIYTCTVCKTQMPDPKTFKQHFESKHPKTPLPPELALSGPLALDPSCVTLGESKPLWAPFF
uniref:C2H2-type domain-containing protein n=1 Tax=Monodelphis domestica TaxID=13616 RepID=A0A5F8G2B5_MONDO